MVEDKLQKASQHSRVEFLTGTTVTKVSVDNGFILNYETHSPLINAEKCNGCGICFQKCPAAGALLQGKAPRVGAYVAIRRELCRFFDDAACTLCRDVCPREAITLTDRRQKGALKADAVLLATGFQPFNPSHKPFGYNRFADVITNLDAERIMREQTLLRRPSDNRSPDHIAFIQCVGSRDVSIGHPWCSKICCGSSLRMARLVQTRQPGTQVTFFYIDIQTFGKDFRQFHEACRESMQFVRAIPGEIFKTSEERLKVVYFDPRTSKSMETAFDMVILSAGLAPGVDNADLARKFHWHLASTGFLYSREGIVEPPPGVFVAGAAGGPMSIAESVNSAGHAAWQMVQYLTSGQG